MKSYAHTSDPSFKIIQLPFLMKRNQKKKIIQINKFSVVLCKGVARDLRHLTDLRCI